MLSLLLNIFLCHHQLNELTNTPLPFLINFNSVSLHNSPEIMTL